MIQRDAGDGTYLSYDEPSESTIPPRFAMRDELMTLPDDLAAEMLTQRLGWIVTPRDVCRIRDEMKP